MSLNLFRTKMKKKKGIGGGHEKKNSDPTGLGMMSTGSYGSGLSSAVQIIGPAGPKEMKRKTVSVTTPPDLSSPSHQPRKMSLTTESPSHTSRSTPTSPLVNAKQSGIPSGPREPTNVSSSLGTSNGGTVFATPLPKVSIAMEDAPLDRQGIIDITVNIQSFMAAISKLKKAMEDSSDAMRTATQSPDSLTNSEPGDAAVASDGILNHLSNLIEVVQTCLSEHSGMQSTEIRDTVKALTQTYNECKHENPGTCPACSNAIEALITAFTNSVSEYLTGESPQNESYAVPSRDLQPPRKGLERANLKGLSKSHDNLSAKYSSFVDLCQPFSEPIVEDIDHALFGVENSTEVAAKYIKMRMKYHKEIVAYLTKRAQIEQRYMNSMNALGKKTLITMMEMNDEHPLPLSEVFTKSVEEDMKLSISFNKTFNTQVCSRLVEPLEAKIQECDKTKKEMTNNWNKEKKKLNEAKTVMRNAMSKYRFLGQDLARVKNLLALDPYGKQAEKRKNDLSNLESRWQEAEQAYKTAVANCNDCQYQVHIAAQKSILCAYRRMVIDCDVQLQSGLEAYFRLQRNCFQSLPEPVELLLEDAGKYQIGSEFMSYIRRHPEQREEPEDYLFEEFDPESEGLMEANENYMESNSLPNSTSTDSTFLNPGAEDAQERSSSPFPSSYSQHEHTTPTHGFSAGGELSSKGSSSVLGISSPRLPKKKARPQSELMELAVGDSQRNSLIRRNSDHTSIQTSTKDSLSPPAIITQPQWQVPPQSSITYSKNALTHTFKKLRGPSRCRECDTYVYFHGHECEVCGLACHKKCLENLAIRCGTKRLARKMNTFGVDFQKHLKATNRCIPIIVTKCIEEIDERALDTRGLYRISSAKTKLEHLCQLFESGADRVDLSDRPSHLIGSCLKLYFRQLPEPLLTFQHYHDFITFARECAYVLPCNLETVTGEKKERATGMLERLRGLLQNLPFENYITLARLLYHLKKVSDPEHVKHNSMPPSNLGIVFGPNLLRQREQVASLALLADMTAQAKTIEIMISHAHDLFQITEDKIKEYEHERDDDTFTQEMLVGEEPYEHQEQTTKSPALLDFEDYLTVGSRTPYNTPPERRRENVYELGEVLEALQLSVGKKNMEGEPHKPMSSLRDHPMSTSLPNFAPLNLPKTVGSEESTLSTLGRFLRSPAAPNPTPLEKMLTPVEEKPAAEHEQDSNVLNSSDEEDDEEFIVSSTSNKIDGPSLSRSGSAFSNPGPTFFIDSEKDGMWDGPARSADLSSPRGRDAVSQIQDEHKEISSQSSEDSNTFEENMPANLRSFFAEISSSAEETPKQKSLDSGKQRHSVLATSDTSSPFQRNIFRSGGSPQKSQSLRGRYSAHVQHPPTISSNSSSAIIKGGSFSEKSRTKKYSISEKYAKYEQCRSERELQKDKKEESMDKKEDSLVPAGTDPDKTVEMEKEEVSEDTVVAEGTQEEQGHTEHNDDVEEGQKIEEVSDSPEVGMELNRRLLEVREISSISKQCDSGIDTPESSKSFKDGVRRLSMPPSDDDIHLADSKPLSHTAAFASRESGIADSPVPDQSLEDNILAKLQKSPHHKQLQHNQSLPLPSQGQVTEDQEEDQDGEENSSRETSQTNPLAARHSSCVEIVVPEEDMEDNAEDTPFIRRRIGSSFSVDRDRGSSVPRSLESPTFSRYARTPIRDSKLLRASDYEGSTGLRFRSVSMDKIPMSYMDIKPPRADDNDELMSKLGSDSSPSSSRNMGGAKSPGMPNSLSTSFIPYHSPPQSLALTGSVRSGNETKQSKAIDGHPSRRYCVNSPPQSTKITPPPESTITMPPPESTVTSPPPESTATSPPPESTSTSPPPSPPTRLPMQTSPAHMSSSTQSAPSTPLVEMSFESPSSSPLSRRKAKIGKGLKQKLKPALRVFKITSSASSDLRQSEILSHTPPLEEDEDGNERDAIVSSTKSCPMTDLGPEIRMIRMVSPEAVDERIPASKYLRRSRSSEDILDVTADDDENDEEGRGETKIGGLVVVPESKHKSRGKRFFNKMKLRKTDSPSASPQLNFEGSQVGKGIASDSEAKNSPVLLSYGYIAQSDGMGMKSPKNPKKRQRTPQYV